MLAIWRRKLAPGTVQKPTAFGALYDIDFHPRSERRQAIVAALVHRHAENRRKRPPQDAPDFLAYGSRFVAMLMGCFLLNEMKIELDQLRPP